ncbi:MAG: transcriptional repressor [Paludibacter sp.]|nr:transcriptional repressor [Paludibacter sp.]
MQKRNTKTKQLVMNVLENSNAALCHEDFEKQLAGSIDRVTIYRILQGFCEDGKTHKIVGDDGKTYYALCCDCAAGEHHNYHPHFHCLKCDTITCVETPIAEQPLPAGYNISSIASLISGYCSKCNNSLTICILLFCFIAFQTAISAQDSIADAQNHKLQEIVVSEYSSRLQRENVWKVEKLNLQNPSVSGLSLTEKLSSIAGIDNFSTGSGIGKPAIRGLSGNRIAVFSQGVRIENQQWGDEHGLGIEFERTKNNGRCGSK